MLTGRPGLRDGVQEDWFKKVSINNGPVPGLLTQAETATGGTLSFSPVKYPESWNVSLLFFPNKGADCQEWLEDFCMSLLSPEVH